MNLIEQTDGSRRNPRPTLFWKAVLLFLFLPATAARASALQPHPNIARGDAGTHWVEGLQWDHVNAFNGNLCLSVPLGIGYPLTDGFSYQLKANYNSNVWDWTQTSQTVSTASPMKSCNAGLGWDLSFGRLVSPTASGNPLRTWLYVSPSGAVRPFYQSLHSDVSDTNDAIWYTRDGSYLRLTVGASTCRVEFPDGMTRTFEPSGDEWRLTRIADRFTNFVAISYAAANTWTITDNHGRTQTVSFKADPTGFYPAIVDKVVVAAFDGTRAAYTFGYATASVALPTGDTDPATPATVNVPLLTGITQPDGTTYRFSYHSTGAATDWSGRAASMELPRKGRVEWTYQTYPFIGDGCATSVPAIFRANTGIAARKIIDGSTTLGTWTFSPSLKLNDSKKCEQGGELANTVTTPLGDKTVYHFSTVLQGTGAWTGSDYGLPLTKNVTDATGSRYLSREYFDCDEIGGNCRLVRSVFVRHEQDGATNPALPDVAQVNRREASARIVYNDDTENGVAHFADVDRSNFDGLGHFRQETTNGDFGGGDVRQTFTNYNATPSVYPSAGFVMPSGEAPWILNIYNRIKIVEGQSARTTDYCFDSRTGFLMRRRIWKTTSPNGTAGSGDVVVVYTPDVTGQVSRVQYFGGDVQPVGTGDLCSLPLSAAQYELRNTHQYGRLASARYYDQGGNPTGVKLSDFDIDLNTGLVKASRNGAGIAVNYLYDSQGNQTWSRPESGHGAWTEYRHVLPSATDGGKKLTYRYTNGGGTVLTYDAEVYNGFGWVVWEQTKLPDPGFPNRYKSYNAMGWIVQESEFSTESPKYKQYLNYTPFGRVGIVRPPDGPQHDVVYQYAGVRKVRKTASVGVNYNPTTGLVYEQLRSTSEVYDRQGRIWKEIRHPNNPTNPDVVVQHDYDVADHLLQSTRDGQLLGSRKSYDGRDLLFLTQDAEGNNSFYSDFDALGNARKQRFDTIDLTYDYDRANRLVAVRETNNPSKIWKEFAYGDANGANDWRAGKPVSAKRYNYPPNAPPTVVRETYTYGGKNGRLSNHAIELSDGVRPPETFSQAYTYTDLGGVEETTYPNNSGGVLTRSRKIVNAYSWGRLTSVNGVANGQNEVWAAAINYHPTGILRQVSHSNGVTDILATDSSGIPRTASVSTSGVRPLAGQPDQNFNSGTFQYDGLEQLVRVGTNYFVYPDSYQPPQPSGSPEPPIGSNCGAVLGPFKLPFVVHASNTCTPLVFNYYSASDQVVKTEDRSTGVDSTTWYFHDLSGRELTRYQRKNTTGAHISTLDFVYQGTAILGTAEILSAPAPSSKTRHFHVGYGIPGIVTNESGYKVND